VVATLEHDYLTGPYYASLIASDDPGCSGCNIVAWKGESLHNTDQDECPAWQSELM